jgi:hypothetical protein
MCSWSKRNLTLVSTSCCIRNLGPSNPKTWLWRGLIASVPGQRMYPSCSSVIYPFGAPLCQCMKNSDCVAVLFTVPLSCYMCGSGAFETSDVSWLLIYWSIYCSIYCSIYWKMTAGQGGVSFEQRQWTSLNANNYLSIFLCFCFRWYAKSRVVRCDINLIWHPKGLSLLLFYICLLLFGLFFQRHAFIVECWK